MDNQIDCIKIPGSATKREWAIYIFVAIPINVSLERLVYVGKVGDNRDGCNPVISRVGNHLSYNNTHSQLRNKIKKIGEFKYDEFNYEYYYIHLGEYNAAEYKNNHELRKTDLSRVNALERGLNFEVKKIETVNKNIRFLNPITTTNKSSKYIISDFDKKIIDNLIKQANINK